MIPLAPETLFHIGIFPITNTLLDTFIIDAVIIAACIYLSKNIKLIPNYFQNSFELITATVYDLTESIAGEKTQKIFPWFMTFLLIILLTNWSGLIPGLTTIGLNRNGEFIPFLRSASTDLNFTLALALVSLATTHIMSITTLGLKEYISRFFSFHPVYLFIGLLELVSEFTKIISFSFRLFGNIFVGELMLTQLSSVMAFLLPIPLVMYEMGVGIIQAVIFGMLTMGFMAILTTPHNAEGV